MYLSWKIGTLARLTILTVDRRIKMKQIYPKPEEKKNKRARSAMAVAVLRDEIYILAQTSVAGCRWIGIGFYGGSMRNRKSDRDFKGIDEAVADILTPLPGIPCQVVNIYVGVSPIELAELILDFQDRNRRNKV